ncbi:hypothetical protein RB5892 [Rhodopirellula baltica SH 1]|uniref:Uncharacterized protein n=1 Tax=Rhodopirellula baltica (strain DSM 10527 / NCIMB 13988 / SH1) TaxID=243090 RepID=Q7UR47_RHOBA|nr:hypothetical protein RB5892 [Rhodopirellula baltica SH 1]
MTFLTAASLYSRLNVRRLSMDRFSCQRSLTCAGPLSTFRGQFQKADFLWKPASAVLLELRVACSGGHWHSSRLKLADFD